MNKDQYQQLCYLTDEILKECAENSVSVAISWLHIIREHPVFLKDYEFLFKNESWCVFQFNLLKRLIRNLLSSCKVVLKSLIRDGSRTWLQMIDRLPKIEVLFISHLLNSKQYKDEDDFYFSIKNKGRLIKSPEKGKVVFIFFYYYDHSTYRITQNEHFRNICFEKFDIWFD